MGVFSFLERYWIVHKPQTNKTYIVVSTFSPPNDYFNYSAGFIVMGGPFSTRYAAECYLPTVLKEIN